MIWLLFGVILGSFAWWHVRENRQLIQAWRRDLTAESAERMERFAWSRTAQLLFVLICCMLAIIIYDQRVNEANRESVSLNQKYEQALQSKAAAQPQTLPQSQVTPLQRPAAPAAAQAAPQQRPVAPPGNYYPPLVTGSPPAQPAPAQTPPAASPRPTVDDVYNPEKKGTGNESVMDGIKKRYENILVTYMFLKQCNKAGANDYPIITSALAQEMASVNAPGRMQADIVTAAQGSYKEMYSRSRCDDPGITTLVTQYTAYVKALSNSIAHP